MILVSSCLIGLETRYNGEGTRDDSLMEFLKDKRFIPVCPEQLGGLSTPRKPCEIQFHDGEEKIINIDGEDKTHFFIKGANEVLKLVKEFDIKYAIFKERSPSCGKGKIYDGSFSSTLISGDGIAAKMLTEAGVKVYNENNFKEMKL
ncbi:MAG: DUF523 domain-containing protein [Firmicutes bacterium]|jgi:uncharacterized protein YbbK (DUF523 family)|nr:DUF523 domain-containing protein [Bacillota bacterium]